MQKNPTNTTFTLIITKLELHEVSRGFFWTLDSAGFFFLNSSYNLQQAETSNQQVEPIAFTCMRIATHCFSVRQQRRVVYGEDYFISATPDLGTRPWSIAVAAGTTVRRSSLFWVSNLLSLARCHCGLSTVHLWYGCAAWRVLILLKHLVT